MSEFYVRPESVQTFANLVEGLGTGVSSAKSYLTAWGTVTGGEDGWIFFNFASAAQDLLDGARGAVNHLGTIVTECGAELMDSATYYASTDTAEAGALDLTYPGGS